MAGDGSPPAIATLGGGGTRSTTTAREVRHGAPERGPEAQRILLQRDAEAGEVHGDEPPVVEAPQDVAIPVNS
jgi:hypothetical protein